MVGSGQHVDGRPLLDGCCPRPALMMYEDTTRAVAITYNMDGNSLSICFNFNSRLLILWHTLAIKAI